MNVDDRLFGTVLGCAISVHQLYKVKRLANVITDAVAFGIRLLSPINLVDMIDSTGRYFSLLCVGRLLFYRIDTEETHQTVC